MKRFERDELAELIVRAQACTKLHEQDLRQVPIDMHAAVASGTALDQANRELWQALFSLQIEQEDDPTQGVHVVDEHRAYGGEDLGYTGLR
jgi:hypothetical protein